MNAEEFLKSKGIIKEGFSEFVITYGDGTKIVVNDLLDEYANQSKPYSEVIANQAIQKNKITKYISIFKDVIKTYLEIENQKSNEK